MPDRQAESNADLVEITRIVPDARVPAASTVDMRSLSFDGLNTAKVVVIILSNAIVRCSKSIRIV